MVIADSHRESRGFLAQFKLVNDATALSQTIVPAVQMSAKTALRLPEALTRPAVSTPAARVPH